MAFVFFFWVSLDISHSLNGQKIVFIRGCAINSSCSFHKNRRSFSLGFLFIRFLFFIPPLEKVCKRWKFHLTNKKDSVFVLNLLFVAGEIWFLIRPHDTKLFLKWSDNFFRTYNYFSIFWTSQWYPKQRRDAI